MKVMCGGYRKEGKGKKRPARGVRGETDVRFGRPSLST